MLIPSKVVEEKAPEVVEEKAPEVVEFKPIKGSIPAQWHIKPLEDDLIEASNSTTGETFEGTISEFNQALRG